MYITFNLIFGHNIFSMSENIKICNEITKQFRCKGEYYYIIKIQSLATYYAMTLIDREYFIIYNLNENIGKDRDFGMTDEKKEKWMLSKFIKKHPYILWIAVVILMLLFPIFLSQLINIGVLDVFSAGMNSETWLSFWGSYIGAIAAIVLAIINYHQSKTIQKLESRPIISSTHTDIKRADPLDVSYDKGPVFEELDKNPFIDGTYAVNISINYHTPHRFDKYVVKSMRLDNKSFVSKNNRNSSEYIIYDNTILFFWEYGNGMSDELYSIFDKENNGPFKRIPMNIRIQMFKKNESMGILNMDLFLKPSRDVDSEIAFRIDESKFEYIGE